ncbi:MAG: MATE family efflux transporter, partial [Nitrospinota bacterium]|nr:MATE family efflux transporter [Nitrospinota bacterium]
GIIGAGLSGGLGRLAGLLVLLFFMFTGRTRIRIRLRHLRPRLSHLRQVVRLSWPISIQNTLDRGAILVLVRIISPFGASALAAWGVGIRVITILRMPGFVMQGAVRTMVGQNVGAGLPGRVLKSTMLSLGTVAVLMVFLTFFLFIWAEPVVRFFGMEGEAARVGVICLRILSLSMGFEACRRPLAGAFQGMGIPKPPMFVEAFFRWAVQLPAALLAAYPLGFAEVGIWWAVTGSQTLAGASLFSWFLLGRPWTHLRARAAGPGPEREAIR